MPDMDLMLFSFASLHSRSVLYIYLSRIGLLCCWLPSYDEHIYEPFVVLGALLCLVLIEVSVS